MVALCATKNAIARGGVMRERTNIMLDIGLKQSLQRLSNKTKMSLSDLINQRLSGSLSVEERIGEKPEWMRNLDPYLANHFSNIELPLPSPLKEYQEKMDEIDSIINDMMVLKEYFRAKFYDEIK
jgi:hypothetical protein